MDISCEELDFCADEIISAINILKTNKAHGSDNVLNEYIKSTKDVFLPIYIKLFNYILQTGSILETWLVGRIFPIYKNKGDIHEPENYRGISILSCFGKFFTSVLNNRLTEFVTNLKAINKNQAGFRKNYSTIDHSFVLKNDIDLNLSNKKVLYCAFVDFQKAFDSVWRVGLWDKLVKTGIEGKFLKIIHNLYSNIKSCIFANGANGANFGFYTGVRQGEILSPLLFSLYVNDMEQYFLDNGCNFLGHTDFVEKSFKLLILLYADDTVIMADNPILFQKSLESPQTYCEKWKLTVNITKTTVMIFRKKKDTVKNVFYYDNQKLDIVHEFKYLGIVFNYNGTFVKHKKHV